MYNFQNTCSKFFPYLCSYPNFSNNDMFFKVHLHEVTFSKIIVVISHRKQPSFWFKFQHADSKVLSKVTDICKIELMVLHHHHHHHHHVLYFMLAERSKQYVVIVKLLKIKNIQIKIKNK